MAPDIGIEFADWVDRSVAELMRSHVRDFATLVERLPGVYPAEVLASLQRLKSTAGEGDGVSRLLKSAGDAIPIALCTSERTNLAIPHPLDYEWHFSRTAIGALTEICNGCTDDAAEVALIGTPTIAALPRTPFGSRKVTYYGADTDALRSFDPPQWIAEFVRVNLLERQLSTRTYATVLVDPPWYEEYFLRFVWFAAQITRKGGTLLLAMPPRGTRPGIPQESIRMLGWCRELGFEREAVKVACLAYDMPPFERNALRAAGIVNVRPEWRKADLWQLTKLRSASPAWPGDVAINPWAEYRFGAVRIRINRHAPCRGEDPRLRSIITGDVLPTVSRRDWRRTDALVWTTGNRIFGCDAPKTLCALLDDWRNGREAIDLSTDIKEGVRRQIETIVEKEGRELA